MKDNSWDDLFRFHAITKGWHDAEYAQVAEDLDFFRQVSYMDAQDFILYNHPRREWLRLLGDVPVASGKGLDELEAYLKTVRRVWR